jgi:ankyrin repeat protein
MRRGRVTAEGNIVWDEGEGNAHRNWNSYLVILVAAILAIVVFAQILRPKPKEPEQPLKPDLEYVSFVSTKDTSVNIETNPPISAPSVPTQSPNTDITIDEKIDYRTTNIFIAAAEGTIRDVEYYVNNGVDVNKKDDSGRTSLHYAAGFNRNNGVLHYLVSKGANVNAKDSVGRTPLHFAIVHNNVSALIYIISRSANINVEDMFGHTPLHLAAYFDTTDTHVEASFLHLLSDKYKDNLDVNAQDHEGYTPLDLARNENKRDELRKRSGKKGEELTNSPSQDIDHSAILASIPTLTPPVIVQQKLSVSTAQSPADIFDAAANGTVQDVRHIIELGTDVRAKNEFGETALHQAAFKNSNVEVLKYLISQGADVNAKNNYGVTPLHQAALGNSNVEILKTLVDQSAEVNTKNQFGATPLHHAAQGNPNAKILEYLISQGADVNAKDNNGKTPLDLAISNPTNRDEKERILRGASGFPLQPTRQTRSALNYSGHLGYGDGGY